MPNAPITCTESAHMRQDPGQHSDHSKRILRRDLRSKKKQDSKKLRAGYYDRCLEPLRESPTPLRVGIAYSLQEIDPIIENKWDIPLHGVVNEHGWFTFVGEERITISKED